MAAIFAFHAGKTIVQIAAVQIPVSDLLQIWPAGKASQDRHVGVECNNLPLLPLLKPHFWAGTGHPDLIRSAVRLCGTEHPLLSYPIATGLQPQSAVYFFMVGFSSPIVFQVVPTIFLFVGLPPRPNDLRERADCRRRPRHPGFPGSARRSDRSVRMGMTDRHKYLPGKAAM